MNNTAVEEFILKATSAREIVSATKMQSLWSGYGRICRYELSGADYESVIVKHVHPPSSGNHPRGWNSDLSHQRKVRSYRVESNWYSHFASVCGGVCKIPELIGMHQENDESLFILEDLDVAGYNERRSGKISERDIELCLQWLARFHALFMNKEPDGLWESGTYWHLQTRPDELRSLDDRNLRKHASAIDDALRSSTFQTIVHGDAKLANFCFRSDDTDVAAVDFQYVGGGCGMKDVAYFIGSCLSERECKRYESALLDIYFNALKVASQASQDQVIYEELEHEWRSLYYYAWADFHRFLKGWSPGHWKINSYSEKVCQTVIADIEGKSRL